MYLLGRDAGGSWKLAADVTRLPPPRLEGLGLGFRELRGLMPALGRGELAIAGHAVALAQWHQVRRLDWERACLAALGHSLTGNARAES